MTTLPLKHGGTTVTVLHQTENAYGDRAWVDGETVPGCLDFPGYSTTGRISFRSESTTSGEDVVTQTRTVYMPFDTQVRAVDRILIHPPGVAVVPPEDTVTRRLNTYDVLGEPMHWRNVLTGWAPATEVALIRIA